MTAVLYLTVLAQAHETVSCPALADALARRYNREPLQYILGTWEFMGLPFTVSPDCLIPRPDTETLVEAALARLPICARVADLCTGRGCIGISLAHYRKDITVTAVELYENTAAAAERNARDLAVSDRFAVIRGDVTKKVVPDGTFFAMIVANPPYIAFNEMEALAPEIAFEPRAALTDEGDGLSVIRGVLKTASDTLTKEGTLLMEFGAAQGKHVLSLAESMHFSGEIIPDAAGHDRVLSAHRCSAEI